MMPRLVVINFHYLSDTTYPFGGIFPRSPVDFEAQLDQLGEIASFVSLEQVQHFYQARGSLPERSCLITFDDGLRCQYEIAWRILYRKGIPGAFFVNTSFYESGKAEAVHGLHWLLAHQSPDTVFEMLTDRLTENETALLDDDSLTQAARAQYRYDTPNVAMLKYLLNFAVGRERKKELIDSCLSEYIDTGAFARSLYMDHDQLRVLANAGSLGTHAHSHTSLASLNDKDLRAEVTRSRDLLQDITGVIPTAISYPYGGPSAVSHAVYAAAQEAGMLLGFTMQRTRNSVDTYPLALGRFDTNDLLGDRLRASFEHFSSSTELPVTV